jgi:signal transduction histidine kinase/ActR/RegA family two-component response regulator
MSGRQALAAGVLIVVVAAVVAIGWTFDITAAKSVMAGWRVMVPATAVSFVPLGLALVFGARRNVMAARLFAFLAALLSLITFTEYLTGIRTGVENWFGVRFDSTSPVAGRMSPLTTLSFISLSLSIIASTVPRRRWRIFSRVASGSALLTAWLSILAVAFDVGRLADVPRFPGMAVMTIALMAIAAWGALALTLDDESLFNAAGMQTSRELAMVALIFIVPLLLGWLQDELTAVPRQAGTALLVFFLSASVAAIVWHYGSRISALRRERERAYNELERRVTERTAELASRNAELHLSQDRLRDADRRKDEFLATLAHELRNPLAPIRNAVAVLRSSEVTDRERDESRVIIDRQVAHMARLIDDLLDVSRIAAGKLPMRKATLPIGDLLNLAVATVRPHLDRGLHRLEVSLPPEPVAVDGDEGRLSQVFANILHNACKYTEPGGTIRLSVSMTRPDEVSISIRDNGIGIPPEFLPRLFDKFSQVAPALDRSEGGLGLGLSLVHGIVTMHGGRVEARSGGPDRGSEFIVHLPAARHPVVNAAATALNGSRDQVPRRVLVVDDNADSAESMAMLLRIQGHVIETAHDGEAALAVAERFRPDAILLDLGMPRLNGYEVCSRLRQFAWGRHVLVIAQTGWGQAQDRARSVEAGFDAHLTKPVDPDLVQEMLTNLKPVQTGA